MATLTQIASYYRPVSLDLAEFGRKLSRCRAQLQLSVAEVANSTGINAARLQAFESGSATPTGDDILVLADFFTCDYRFFISNERLAAFEQTDSLYRMHGDDFSKEDRRNILEFIFLCECEQQLEHDLERPIASFDFIPRGSYFKRHGADAADALRRHFGYEPTSVPSNVYADFRKLGFHLFRRRLANSNVSGLTIRHPSAGTCILVNFDEDIYRQRFTAAHEAGHGILDRDRDVVVSFAAAPKNDKLVEVRANTFAAHYVLPPSLVRGMPVLRWDENEALRWASHFKVSTTALAISLRTANLIDEATARQLQQVRVPAESKIDPELSGLQGRVLERKRELLQRGLCSYYVELVFEALSKELITARRAAEMMLVNEFELVDIATLFGRSVQAP